jgi:hypothetical protein
MNASAEKHLAKAETYLGKGEEFYRKAAEEIVAAQEADPALSNREIARRMGRGEAYVRTLLEAASRAAQTGVFEMNWKSGTNARSQVVAKTLREAPLEQIEQLISTLPKDRQQAIGAAAGNEYLKARQNYDETERNLTGAERKEREAASESLTQKVREATGGFLSLGIAAHIEQATEELRELDAPTEETMRIISVALTDLCQEFQVKAAMVGLDYERIEV